MLFLKIVQNYLSFHPSSSSSTNFDESGIDVEIDSSSLLTLIFEGNHNTKRPKYIMRGVSLSDLNDLI